MATESSSSDVGHLAGSLLNEKGEICIAGSTKELKESDSSSFVDRSGDTEEIAHHVDTESTKSLGSGEVESESSHQEVESDSSSKISSADVNAVVDSVHEAADFAHEAAVSCERAVKEFASAIEVCRKITDSAAKIADAAGMHRASYYNFKQRRCKRVTKKIKHATGEAEQAADQARATADNAEIYASELLEVLNTDAPPEVVREKSLQASAAKRTAKAEAANAYQKKYLLLLALKECWDLADSMANNGSTSPDTWTSSKKKLFIIVGIVAFIVFIVLLFVFVPLVGGILLIPVFIYCCVQIGRFVDRRRKATKRRETLRKLNRELCDLQHYCERSSIPLYSQDEMSTRL